MPTPSKTFPGPYLNTGAGMKILFFGKGSGSGAPSPYDGGGGPGGTKLSQWSCSEKVTLYTRFETQKQIAKRQAQDPNYEPKKSNLCRVALTCEFDITTDISAIQSEFDGQATGYVSVYVAAMTEGWDRFSNTAPATNQDDTWPSDSKDPLASKSWFRKHIQHVFKLSFGKDALVSSELGQTGIVPTWSFTLEGEAEEVDKADFDKYLQLMNYW